MNISKPTSVIALASIGVMAFFLQDQPVSSSPNLPAQAQAFAMHYAECELTIPAGVNDERGAFPGIASLRLPVLDRTVRIAMTVHAANGEVAFGEVPAYYKSSTQECAFHVNGWAQSGHNLSIFSNDSSVPFFMSAGPNGTLVLENLIPSPAVLKVAFWY